MLCILLEKTQRAWPLYHLHSLRCLEAIGPERTSCSYVFLLPLLKMTSGNLLKTSSKSFIFLARAYQSNVYFCWRTSLSIQLTEKKVHWKIRPLERDTLLLVFQISGWTVVVWWNIDVVDMATSTCLH